MSERETHTGISAVDWAATPDAVRVLVLSLLATVERLSPIAAARHLCGKHPALTSINQLNDYVFAKVHSI